MHELVVTKNILNIAKRYAVENGASRVKSIFLRIGILRDMEPEWVQRYFRYISKGTIAEDAEIFIMVEPVLCKCHSCGEQFELNLRDSGEKEILCPSCMTHNYELISGMEFILSGIEVE